MSYLYLSYGYEFDEYKPKSKKQSDNNIIKSGYIREARVGQLAIQLANYECALDKKHETFIS